jgi:hypothetical protein
MPQVESEIRASVDEFVRGIRALVERSVFQLVARSLEVDVVAAALAKRPAPPGHRVRPAERSPEPRRVPARALRAELGRSRPRKAASHPDGRGRAGALAGGVERAASALLAHIKIEPGQGLKELALAMGTPAAELAAPIRRLLSEHKIRERGEGGKATYYPS